MESQNMRINIIYIDPKIQKKIYEKHNILAAEIRRILKDGEPVFKKVGGNQLMAIGLYNRYITIYFKYDEKIKLADITTAYPSDKKQISYYKKIRRL